MIALDISYIGDSKPHSEEKKCPYKIMKYKIGFTGDKISSNKCYNKIKDNRYYTVLPPESSQYYRDIEKMSEKIIISGAEPEVVDQDT